MAKPPSRKGSSIITHTRQIRLGEKRKKRNVFWSFRLCLFSFLFFPFFRSRGFELLVSIPFLPSFSGRHSSISRASPIIMSDKKRDDYVLNMPHDGHHEKKDMLLERHASSNYSSTLSSLEHSAGLSILAYCLSSISMTIVNKYVVSGVSWNLNFLYVAAQVGNRVDPCICAS